LKISKVAFLDNTIKVYALNEVKNGMGYILGDFFAISSGHPGGQEKNNWKKMEGLGGGDPQGITDPLSEKFPNCTSETIKARPFQRVQKYFCTQ
jgi:hypothetical protein